MILSGPDSIYYSNNAYYAMKVYGTNGKVVSNKYVTIKIGRQSFKVKTNTQGVAKIKIPYTKVTVGKFTVRLIYNDFSISKILTVKQVLTLKRVNVKKSAKRLVLTATLKKGNTAIKSKVITFKFNGITNSRGIAKIIINSNMLKKLKVGKNFTYQATYLKNTVKQTVKIKK